MPVTAVRSPTATGSGTGSGRRAPLTRRPGGGATGGSRRPRKIPQFPQKRPPGPPPPTPFQPGAAPAPLLNPLQLAGLGVLAGLQVLWDMLNRRPPPITSPPGVGDTFMNGSATNANFQVLYDMKRDETARGMCGPPISNLADIPGPTTPLGGNVFNGVGITIARASRVVSVACGSGPAINGPSGPIFNVLKADGSSVAGDAYGGNGSSFSFFFATTTDAFVNFRFVRNGVTTPLQNLTPQEVPEVVQPAAPALAPIPAPAPAPDPAAEPVPPIVPADVPGAIPVPAPAPAPGGLPGTAPRPSTPPQPIPAPAPLPAAVPALPAARPITAAGVRPLGAPPIRQTPTGSTFLPGGVELPNNGPPPTLQGMATELGKLERKLEIALAPEGPLSLLQQLNRVIDQIENIKFLLDNLFPPEPYTFAAGAYKLAPVCDRDAQGELIEPLEAPWASGQGEVVEIRRKIDALAKLIQHHKNLKQPICSPRGNGNASNVTVHFESD